MAGVQTFEVIEGGRATTSTDRRGRAAAAGALILLGVGLASVAGRRRRRARDADAAAHRSDLGAYLREHLQGSDEALHIVDRLRHAHDRADDRVLFARLFDEFQEERQVVRGLITALGESSTPTGRLAAKATGTVQDTVAEPPLGDGLALLRTLEALATRVQGKRCLWRTLQSLDPAPRAPGYRNFAELESMAVRQWESIEQRRRALASETFAWRLREAEF